MPTSRATFTLSKPVGESEVPLGTFGYFRARNKRRAVKIAHAHATEPERRHEQSRPT
jgi:hypothetical protein